MPRVRLRRRRTTLAAVVALVLGALAAGPVRAVDEPTATPAVTTTREVIGESVRGRPIRVFHRAPKGATTRVLVVGSLHGDEQAGMRVVRRLLSRDALPRRVDLWLVPTVNPDGTVAYTRTNTRGVDLNRNFPYRWRTSARGATWSGMRPLSEPESRSLRDLVRRLDPALTVTFHQPLFGVGANDKAMPVVRAIAEGMRLPVRDFKCTGICPGSFTSWLNARTEGLAVTVEFARTVPAWRIRAAERTILRVGERLASGGVS